MIEVLCCTLPYSFPFYFVFFFLLYYHIHIHGHDNSFISFSAKFVPTSGRFTKTVNKGDVNVTVDFIEVTPSETEKDWRFNGTTDLYWNYFCKERSLRN